MNFILIFLITAILQCFTPWWTIALIPFVIMLWRPTSSSRSFITSFLAVSLLWLAYGLYLHVSSEGMMSNRIAAIFSLPNGILLLILTTLIGGLVGGLSGLSGYFVRRMVA